MSRLQLELEPGVHADLSKLRGLADARGNVSADKLYSATGVSEGFLSGLERQLFEQKLGPGPWSLAQLESLLVEGRVQPLTQPASFASPAAPPGPQDAPTLPYVGSKDKLDDSVPLPRRQSFFRCLPELVQLDRLVDDALANEDTEGNDEIEEPESEHPTMECSLSRLERATAACINSPGLLQGQRGEQEEDAARRMLPALLQDAIGMLKKTWRLAHVRSQHIQQLVEGAQLTSGQEAQEHENEDSQIILTPRMKPRGSLGVSSSSDMASIKKVLKEKDWELSHARQRNEQLEEERASLETRLLQVDLSRQREAWKCEESERRLADLQNECSRSAEQRNDLRRRLAAAKIALGQAHEALTEARRELGSAERRREEARLTGDWRAAELESELVASKQVNEELRSQLRQQNPSVTDGASDGGHDTGRPPAVASRLAEQQQQEQQQQQQQHPTHSSSPSNWPSRPRACSLEVVKEEDGAHGEESDHDSSCSSEARFATSTQHKPPPILPWAVPPLSLPPPPGVPGESQQQAAAVATPKRQDAQSAPVPAPAPFAQRRTSMNDHSRAGSPTPSSPPMWVARTTHAVQQRMSPTRAGASSSWSPSSPLPRSPKDSIAAGVEKQVAFFSMH